GSEPRYNAGWDHSTPRNVPGAAKGDALVQCTHCGSEWPDDAVLCVQCGLNFQTGQRLQTVRGRRKKEVARTLDRDLRGSTPRKRIISGVVFLVVLSVLLVVLPFIPGVGSAGLVIFGVPVYLVGVLAALLRCGSFTRVRVEPGRHSPML